MERYGRINKLGDLIIPNNVIQTEHDIIINPTEEKYLENGYKKIIFEKQPKEKIGFNIEKYYEETEDCIYVKYKFVENENTEEIS